MKTQYLTNAAAVAAMAVTFLFPAGAGAANDMFLKLDGIKGESQDRDHRDEIDVLSWSWGESAGTARTRRGTVPTACIQDLVIIKSVDAASPHLIINAVTGASAPSAVLTVRKAGDKPLEYVVIKMTNVIVTSYQTGGSGGEDRLTENVTLNFERMTGTYTKQNPDGSAGEQTIWDISGGSSRGCQ